MKSRSLLLGSCLLAVLAAGCGEAGGRGGRLIVLGIDGLDPDVVRMMVAEGQLPHFARLIDEGASGVMHSPPPLLSPVIWTTIATGRRPSEHGIGHFTSVDPATGEELPVTSALRRSEALWTLFSERDREVAVVGWWATWPAEPVDGVLISDRAGYHFLMGEQVGKAQGGASGVVWPAERHDELMAFLRPPEDVGFEEASEYVDVPRPEFDHAFDFADDLSHFRWALATAQSYRRLGLHLWREERPDLLMVYIEGVDSISHLFGHLYRQEGLAGELAEQQRRYGGTVEAMYRLADEIVGDYLAAMDADTTLMVLSDHGFQLGELLEDPTQSRDMRRVSEEFHRSRSSLFLYGRGVVPGGGWRDADTLDITPTLLALAGLPAGQDMPGRVLEEALTIEVPERLSTLEQQGAGGRKSARRGDTPADEGGGGNGAEGEVDAEVDAAVLERLRSLGYLGGAGEAGDAVSKNDRNLAAILLREGEYREAAKSFQRLLEQEGDDAVLLTGLAAALAHLGRDQPALEALDRALELDPLHVPALFNRGLLHERTGRREAAIADYRTALRYDAEHRPSRRALERLGVPVVGRAAVTEAEQRAGQLLRQARDLARHGDYRAADRLLMEAEELAPDAAVVLHYRANVAYLEGDREAAVRFLERALVLEPDNQLLRENLDRLLAGSGTEEPER